MPGRLPAKVPIVKSLQCPKCGAPQTVRGGPRTRMLVCGYCDVAFNPHDPMLRILARYNHKVKFEPLIPLGTRATLQGELLECIGYLRRTQKVEGLSYTFSEYLLFNPRRGYRWLSEMGGHFTLYKECDALPVGTEGMVAANPPMTWVTYMDTRFRHFQSYEAEVTYVLGEFYWDAKVGNVSNLYDYVSPPKVLSGEVMDGEIIWTLGTYVDPKEVWDAFKLPGTPGAPVGVAPNQISPLTNVGWFWSTFGLMVAICFLITLCFTVLGQNRVVFADKFTYFTNERERSQVTNFFTVPGRTSNLIATVESPDLSNRWASYHLTLINDDTAEGTDFGLDTYYYFGESAGEKWTDGSRSASAVLPQVPKGRYYLRIEPESGIGDKPDKFREGLDEPGSEVFHYTVSLTRDRVQWTYFWWAFLFLLPFPLLQGFRSWSFENRRWMDSDHPRTQTTA